MQIALNSLNVAWGKQESAQNLNAETEMVKRECQKRELKTEI